MGKRESIPHYGIPPIVIYPTFVRNSKGKRKKAKKKKKRHLGCILKAIWTYAR